MNNGASADTHTLDKLALGKSLDNKKAAEKKSKIVLTALHKRLGYKKLTSLQRLSETYSTSKRKYVAAISKAD